MSTTKFIEVETGNVQFVLLNTQHIMYVNDTTASGYQAVITMVNGDQIFVTTDYLTISKALQ